MALTSDELNLLIYRYLRESGFEHSAFTFGHESLIHKSSIDGSAIPPAALITYIQKGLQYVEIETHLTDDGNETICDEPFSIFRKHVCKSRGKKRVIGADEALESDYGTAELNDAALFPIREHQGFVTAVRWATLQPYLATAGTDGLVKIWDVNAETSASIEEAKKPSQKLYIYSVNKTISVPQTEAAGHKHVNGHAGINGNSESASEAPVKDEQMAVDEHKAQSDEHQLQPNGIKPHVASSLSWCSYEQENRSVVSIDWSADNTCIAIATYNGQVVVHHLDRDITIQCQHHTAPISQLRWNASTDKPMLVSAGFDNTIAVWDLSQLATADNNTTLSPVTVVRVHSSPVLDVEWRNDTSFASAAADGELYLHTLTEPTAEEQTVEADSLKLAGHDADINCLRFDFSHTLLATCSDDCAVKVWNVADGTLLHHFTDHTKEVTTLAWISSSTDPAVPSPALLASGSLDSTVRVWDLQSSRCAGVLGRQLHPVTTLAYNPAAQLLAAAAYQRLYIFSIVDGSLIRTFAPADAATSTSINLIEWDSSPEPAIANKSARSVATTQRIAIAYSDGNTYIIDLRV